MKISTWGSFKSTGYGRKRGRKSGGTGGMYNKLVVFHAKFDLRSSSGDFQEMLVHTREGWSEWEV